MEKKSFQIFDELSILFLLMTLLLKQTWNIQKLFWPEYFNITEVLEQVITLERNRFSA